MHKIFVAAAMMMALGACAKSNSDTAPADTRVGARPATSGTVTCYSGGVEIRREHLAAGSRLYHYSGGKIEVRHTNGNSVQLVADCVVEYTQ